MSFFVNIRHNYLNHPKSVERQSVSVSQRLAPQLARNARRFQECPDLVRVNLTICNEYASSMLIHAAPPSLNRVTDGRHANGSPRARPPARIDAPDASDDNGRP